MDANLKQREAESLVSMNYGRTYGEALKSQESIGSPQHRKEAAANMLATAAATTNRDPISLNRLDAINGRAAMQKAYGSRTPEVNAILSGRVVDYDLPKSVEVRKDMNVLVSKSQALIKSAAQDGYAVKGIFTHAGARNEYLDQAHNGQIETTEKLTNHLLHVKSSIDASVDRYSINKTQGDALYQRFENASFSINDEKTGGTKNQAYRKFEASEIQRIRNNVLKEVNLRYAAQQQVIDRAKAKEVIHSNDDLAKELGKLAGEMENKGRSNGVVPALENSIYIAQMKGLKDITMTINKSFEAANTHVALPIGSKMILTEHQSALSKLGGAEVGHIELPKQMCAYTGKVIQVSDTHIVQQVNKNLAYAHDISKLTNGKELRSLAEEGKLRNVELKIEYSEKQATALQSLVTKEKLQAMADKSKSFAQELPTQKSRDAFTKQIDSFIKTREQAPNVQKIAAPIIKAAQPEIKQQSQSR